MNKTLRIFGNLSALIGIAAFIYPLLSEEKITLSTIQIIFIVISSLIFFIYLFIEIFTGPKKYKTDEAIKNYMKTWINKTGRTVIFTRDMSWVDNEIKNDLKAKASNKDLIICHPELTPLTRELKNDGAEVYEYKNLKFTPKSRFTFINYNSNSSKVAIGKKDDKHVHYITEYSTKDTIEYHLAEDLVNLIKSLN